MKNYTTKIGYKMMTDDLENLTSVEYRNAIQMLQEARDKETYLKMLSMMPLRNITQML
jgi:hypothetical protein